MSSLTRAVVYTRVSTQDQKDGVSLEMQLDLARKYCDEQGWLLAEVYTDVMSGTSSKRPQFKRMEADAKARRFDVVLFYKVDRFARSAATFFKVASSLMAQDVTLVSLTENLDFLTASGKAMVGMQAVFAEFFSNQLSERVKGAMRAVTAKGKLPGGIIPLGYERVEGRYEVIHEEAKTVQELYRTFLETKSIRATADHMNSLGLRTKLGGPFYGPGVKVILQNPLYYGALAYGKNQILKNEEGGKRKKWLPRDQWVLVEGVHPALVSKEDWEAVQGILESNSAKHSRIKYGQARYAWSGLIRCQACGEVCVRYGSNPRTLKGKTYNSPSYICRTFTVRGKSSCEGYAYVSDAFLRLRAVPALAEFLEGSIKKDSKKQRKAKPVIDHRAKRIADLETRREREKELFRSGYSNFEEMAGNIRRLEIQIAELSTATKSAPKPLNLPGGFLPLWDKLTEAGRGELLRSILDRCEASKTEFTFYFRPVEGMPDTLTIPRDNVRGPRAPR